MAYYVRSTPWVFRYTICAHLFGKITWFTALVKWPFDVVLSTNPLNPDSNKKFHGT